MQHAYVGKEIVLILVLMSLIILWDRCIKSIPSSAFAVLLGMFVSLFYQGANSSPVTFASELFLYLLLPPILFHSALKFKVDSLKTSWLSSLTFAWVGTLMAVFLIAWGIIVWTHLFNYDISTVEALILASILAPTDTVATLSMSKTLQLRDRYILDVLENESVMNDAMSVVLVHLFSKMSSVDKWVPMEVIGLSILYSCLAITLGVCTSKWMAYMNVSDVPIHYIVALLIYAVCEWVSISGILCLFAYGSCCKAPKEVHNTMESVSTLFESYVYLMLGLALQSYDTTLFGLSFLILMSCVVARVTSVFFLGGCLRLCGRQKWTIRYLLFFSMCGVRGAISYALSSSQSSFMRGTTFVVIISTILCMGAFQKCMYRILLQ